MDGSTAECLDLESGRWYPIAPTLTKRDSLGLVNLDGGDQLYAVGGYNNLENTYLRYFRPLIMPLPLIMTIMSYELRIFIPPPHLMKLRTKGLWRGTTLRATPG